MARKRIVRLKVLPGQPLDGSGRVCIHLFVQDPSGPFVEPHALHQDVDDAGQPTKQLVARPTRGRLACDPKRLPAPTSSGTVTTVTMRTDDPRAVTCPRCVASPEWQGFMDAIAGAAVGAAHSEPDTNGR